MTDGASWHLEYAWLGGGHRTVARDVLVEVRAGRVDAVTPDTPPLPGSDRLTGLTLPGLANAHSHAFHRAVRGVPFSARQAALHRVVERLDPNTLYALARATYAEMALAGVTCVGEFHYLHHQPDGTPYADPNAMSTALVDAAAAAGIRITLLDSCYLSGGLGENGPTPLDGSQRGFGDANVRQWAERVDAFRPTGDHVRVGAAIQSVRHVPPAAIADVAGWREIRDAPLHVQVSELRSEHSACITVYGLTPIELLADAGALGPQTTLVHATHVDADDLERIGDARPHVCLCPATEADRAEGTAPAAGLADAGSVCLGTDGHARIDLFEEARTADRYERLTSGHPEAFDPDELLVFATAGHEALGWSHSGWLGPGARVDLVTVGLDSVRLAGAEPPHLLDAVVAGATAADVRHVVVDGRAIVRDGVHQLVDDVPRALHDARAVLRS